MTRIARRMISDFGMSDLGPIKLGPQYDNSHFGRAMMEPSQLSNETQAKVDKEISRVIDDAYKLAMKVLTQHRDKLDVVSAKLVEVETLDGEEFEKLMGVAKLRPKER